MDVSVSLVTQPNGIQLHIPNRQEDDSSHQWMNQHLVFIAHKGRRKEAEMREYDMRNRVQKSD